MMGGDNVDQKDEFWAAMTLQTAFDPLQKLRELCAHYVLPDDSDMKELSTISPSDPAIKVIRVILMNTRRTKDYEKPWLVVPYILRMCDWNSIDTKDVEMVRSVIVKLLVILADINDPTVFDVTDEEVNGAGTGYIEDVITKLCVHYQLINDSLDIANNPVTQFIRGVSIYFFAGSARMIELLIKIVPKDMLFAVYPNLGRYDVNDDPAWWGFDAPLFAIIRHTRLFKDDVAIRTLEKIITAAPERGFFDTWITGPEDRRFCVVHGLISLLAREDERATGIALRALGQPPWSNRLAAELNAEGTFVKFRSCGMEWYNTTVKEFLRAREFSEDMVALI